MGNAIVNRSSNYRPACPRSCTLAYQHLSFSFCQLLEHAQPQREQCKNFPYLFPGQEVSTVLTNYFSNRTAQMAHFYVGLDFESPGKYRLQCYKTVNALHEAWKKPDRTEWKAVCATLQAVLRDPEGYPSFLTPWLKNTYHAHVHFPRGDKVILFGRNQENPHMIMVDYYGDAKWLTAECINKEEFLPSNPLVPFVRPSEVASESHHSLAESGSQRLNERSGSHNTMGTQRVSTAQSAAAIFTTALTGLARGSSAQGREGGDMDVMSLRASSVSSSTSTSTNKTTRTSLEGAAANLVAAARRRTRTSVPSVYSNVLVPASQPAYPAMLMNRSASFGMAGITVLRERTGADGIIRVSSESSALQDLEELEQDNG